VAPVIAVGWLMLIVATVSVVVMHHHRFRALVLIGIIGLSISAGFAYLSAPDLALTQISVETVTIMLLLLALHFMPKVTPKESPAGLKLRDGAIALAAGGGVGALAYAFLMRDIETISDYHIANSYEGGGGTNVVNVILVDFRGYDTFGEIIVLGIAGLVIYALMHALLDGPAARRLKNMDYAQDRSRDRHPLMMVVVTRVLMPIAIVVGLYIFLRGHNEPGGGFVAGLVIAIALLMQYMASGFAWTQERKRIEYHTMIGLGVVIAGLTGRGIVAVGQPVPDQRLHLCPPAADRGVRACHRDALRSRRVPDGAGGGHADALQPQPHRAFAGRDGERRADGLRPGRKRRRRGGALRWRSSSQAASVS
jgi:multicomponent K+:H+ antiporter subunit A